MHKKVRKPGRKAGRKAGRPKGSKNRVPPLPPPVPQEPEEARATAAATLNRLLLTCTDTTEARRLGAQIVLLTAAPRPKGEPVPYTDTPRAKAIRQRAQDRHTEKDDEKNRTYDEQHGTPHAPSTPLQVAVALTPEEQAAYDRCMTGLTDAAGGLNGGVDALAGPAPLPPPAEAEPEAESEAVRKAASMALSGALLQPPPTPATPAATPDEDFAARVRMRMQRNRESNQGPADYNNPRAFSVTECRERESDFPDVHPQDGVRERYSANGFSGRTSIEDGE